MFPVLGFLSAKLFSSMISSVVRLGLMHYNTNFYGRIPFSDKNFKKIIQFFLFECPVKGVSQRGKSFEEFGWKGSPSFSKLKKEMLSVEGSTIKTNYYPCKREELKTVIKDCSVLTPPTEYCVFLRSDERTVMQSLYKAIRNAFAHGSFNRKSYNKTKFYYFENYDKYLKAKIAIKESTLLDWIVIVQNGENKLQ